MNLLLHPTPSIGSTIKKLLAINPNLTTREIIEIVQQSIRTQGQSAGDFATAQVVDEKKAIELAKATLKN
jgi:hypothetical protein